jgi:hypothetical protein
VQGRKQRHEALCRQLARPRPGGFGLDVIANDADESVYRFSTYSPLRNMTRDMEALALYGGQVCGQGAIRSRKSLPVESKHRADALIPGGRFPTSKPFLPAYACCTTAIASGPRICLFDGGYTGDIGAGQAITGQRLNGLLRAAFAAGRGRAFKISQFGSGVRLRAGGNEFAESL